MELQRVPVQRLAPGAGHRVLAPDPLRLSLVHFGRRSVRIAAASERLNGDPAALSLGPMGPVLRLHAVDLDRFRAMLGSGEERFCAAVLKRVPPAAEKRGLVKEWKRAVTGLVLGVEGERLSSRSPFERSDPTRADPALSLAFASLVEGFAPEGLRRSLAAGPQIPGELLARPLFGMEPDGVLVRWGGLNADEVKPLRAHPRVAPIALPGLGILSLSGSAWADGEPEEFRESLGS